MSSKSDSEGLVSRKNMGKQPPPVIPIHNRKEDQNSSNGKEFFKVILRVLILKIGNATKLSYDMLFKDIWFIVYWLINLWKNMGKQPLPVIPIHNRKEDQNSSNGKEFFKVILRLLILKIGNAKETKL